MDSNTFVNETGTDIIVKPQGTTQEYPISPGSSALVNYYSGEKVLVDTPIETLTLNGDQITGTVVIRGNAVLKTVAGYDV